MTATRKKTADETTARWYALAKKSENNALWKLIFRMKEMAEAIKAFTDTESLEVIEEHLSESQFGEFVLALNAVAWASETAARDVGQLVPRPTGWIEAVHLVDAAGDGRLSIPPDVLALLMEIAEERETWPEDDDERPFARELLGFHYRRKLARYAEADEPVLVGAE